MFKLSTICYIDNGREILMLHRDKDPNDQHYNKWIGVGGKFEKNETPEECAIREIKEETGLDVIEMNLLGIITFPEFTKDTSWYSFVFHVTDYSGELIECDEGTLKWVAYEDLLTLPTWEGDYKFIQWFLDKKPFYSAKFEYQGDKLINDDVIFYAGKERG